MKGKAIAILVAIIILAATALYYAPRFLAYADKPVKSDAIILFVGDGSSAREKEARSLLNEGYAKFLIIPSLNYVITSNNIPVRVPITVSLGKLTAYPQFYEHTHMEALKAKEMMNVMGLRSAIMVSSHYHMRRIEMICAKIFGGQATYISYVPTDYEHEPVKVQDMNCGDWLFIMREFAKICWYTLYSAFI